MRYRGIAVCSGVVLDHSFRIAPLPQFDPELRANQPREDALDVFKRALEQLHADFSTAMEQSENMTNTELIGVQLAMLEDESFSELITSGIAEGYAPQAAVLRAAKTFEQMLIDLDDEYMAARADDVRDLGVRLACRIANMPYPSLSGLLADCIVLAQDLLPSMLMTARLQHIRGIVTENGTKTSHISILASGLEIPTIVGCKGIMDVPHGELVFLDGERGVLESGLDTTAVQKLTTRESAWQKEREELRAYASREAVTADGVSVNLLANIVNPLALDRVLSYRADGVGLFRTEFLYMNRSTLPDEEEQFSLYSAAAKKLGDRPLTIRTMDIGGDKEAECLHLPAETNPFMGYRAVRISLDRKDLLLPQLRAILRAAAYGNIWVMFPMIAVKKELTGMLAALDEAKEQLKAEGVPFGENIRTGIMVEVPSAVLQLDHFAKLVDFVSIGSNDLTQYTYAADRMNARVGYLYNFLDPAVLRLIKRTIDISAESGIACSLCGEMAGDALGLAALIALGIKKISVSPSGILTTKKRLSMLDTAVLAGIGESMINAEDATEVEHLLCKTLPQRYTPKQREEEA
jgi:phosphotransferase system enzyme I (PtsI)